MTLFFAMLAREPVSWHQLASLSFAVWLNLGIIAVFTLTLAMTLFFWVIKRIDFTQAAPSIYLLPVFGVLISTVTLKERVRWQLLAGGIFGICRHLSRNHVRATETNKLNGRTWEWILILHSNFGITAGAGCERQKQRGLNASGI